MKPLLLGDFAGETVAEVRRHMVEVFEITKEDLEPYEILIAFEDDGGWEGWNFFLLRKGNRLFENNGSHCSCYHYEGQFNPEPTTLAYLRSDKFHFSGITDEVREWIAKHL